MKIEKYLTKLPDALDPNTLYFVKKKDHVLSYISNPTGTSAYEIKGGEQKINLSGQNEVVLNIPQDFIITNFDTHTVYTVTSDTGIVVQNNEVITYTATLEQISQSFSINGRLIDLTLIEGNGNTPPTFVNEVCGFKSYDFLENIKNLTSDNDYIFVSNKSVSKAPDGSLFVLNQISANDGNAETKFLVVKLTPTKEIDLNFGFKIISFDDVYVSNTITAVQSDGKLLIGFIKTNKETNQNIISVMRLNANSDIDTTYGVNGCFDLSVSLDANYNYFPFGSMELTAENELLIVPPDANPGFTDSSFILKLTINGELDTTFGVGGKFVFLNDADVFKFSGLKINSNNEIIFYGDKLIVLRGVTLPTIGKLDQFGVLVSSFGTNGFVDCTEIENVSNFGSETFVNFLSDGSIVYAAMQYSSGLLLLFKLNLQGNLETSFGNNGVLIQPSNYNQRERCTKILITPDDSILLSFTQYNLDPSITEYFCTTFKKFTKNGVFIENFHNGKPLKFNGYENLELFLDAEQNVSIFYTPSEKLLNCAELYTITQNGNLINSNPVSMNTVKRVFSFGFDFCYFFYPFVNVFDANLASYNNGEGSYEGAVFSCKRMVASSSDNFGVAEDGFINPQTSQVIIENTAIGNCIINQLGHIEIIFNGLASQALLNKFFSSFYYFCAYKDEVPDSSSFDLIVSFYDGNTGEQGTGGSLKAETTLTFYQILNERLTPLPDTPLNYERIADGKGGYFNIPAVG